MKKNTKIVATIGPASDKKEILRQLVENGMNVARLNFSHGDYTSDIRVIENVRSVAQEMDKNIGVMADLQGPRIRTIVSEDFEIKPDEKILVYSASRSSQISNSPNYLISNKNSNFKIIGLDYAGILEDIEVGNEILIEDGLIRIKVIEKKDEYLIAEVIDGGIVKNEKGVNIPDAKLKIPAITPKDEEDLLFALGQNVDFVALSFVSTAQDIIDLKNKMIKILGERARIPQIVAKIERKEAIKNLDEIINETDVVMVARGDLGIEIEESKVAILQKEIIAKSLSGMKPVIVATQMLDSMINNPRPTRAEVSDVSNAVIDHTDAVMLSGESANGKYPVETVKTMTDIIRDTEESPYDDVYETIKTGNSYDYVTIVKSAYELSKNPNVKAILVKTVRGFTARIISHFRPNQPILVATDNQKTFNQLSVVWGTEASFFEEEKEPGELIERLIEKEKANGVLKSGDKVVIILGKDLENKEINLIGLKEIN
jgi:pyruvate kinase